MNTLLEQQIKDYLTGVDLNDPSLQHFIQIINDTYNKCMASKYQQNLNELIEQKHRSDILSRELQTFKLAVEDAADLITFFDENMKFVYANKAATSDDGFGDVVGKTVSEVSGSLNIDARDFIGHIVKGDERFTSDLIFPDEQQGIDTVIQIMTTIVHDAQNRKMAINIGRNVTKERELEKEKDEFVAIASHELRTPMTVIRGFISLLEREQLGPINQQQKEVLEKMSRNAKVLIDLVNDMLDLSKLEANKLEMAVTNNPVGILIDIVIEKMRVLYEGKGITLVFNNSNASDRILTDPDKFDRIMSNLLSNAYKFTAAKGSVAVYTNKNPQTGMLTVCISDTGIGIPASSIDNLFKKFSQVNSLLQRQTEGGTGLGLAICKELVEKLGGRIWVKSKPGVGSQFYFTTPVAKDIV